MMIPDNCITLQEASRVTDPAAIFEAVSAYRLHMLTWGNEENVREVSPEILKPEGEINFCPDKSAAAGCLVFERNNPRPWAGDNWICRGHRLAVFFRRAEFNKWASKSSRGTGGAPLKYDREYLEILFQKKVLELKLPHPQNVKGWRNQSDVEKWIIAECGSEAPSIQTARRYANAFIRRAKMQDQN